jgi:hypothetical protein
MKEHVSEGTKHVVDGISLVTVVGTLTDLLPAVAALFTIVWTVIRIYETKTVQGWINRAKQK